METSLIPNVHFVVIVVCFVFVFSFKYENVVSSFARADGSCACWSHVLQLSHSPQLESSLEVP